MKIIAAFLLGLVVSTCLLFVKTTDRWKPWLSFYFLWMAVPALFTFVPDYVQFIRTVPGRIFFLITLIIAIALWVINRKKPSKALLFVQQLAIGVNYPLLMIDIWITTCKMIGRAIRFFISK